MIILYDDDIPTKRFPIITSIVIFLNVIVFLCLISSPENYKNIVTQWGFTPSHPTFLTLITSLFIHPTLSTLIVSMFCLWVFGDNIEEKLGRIFFIVFYLLSGIFTRIIIAKIGYAAQFISSDTILGGSWAATTSLLGAYFVFFPHAKIKILILFFLRFSLSALSILGFIVAYNLLMGYFQLDMGYGGAADSFGAIAGFIFGAFIANILRFFFSWNEISNKK